MPTKSIKMAPIGYVRRASKNENVKDRSLVCRIVIRKDLIEALEGVEDFSHLFVIFYMHKIRDREKALKVHPRGRTDLPLLGVFATRTALRPDPIGLTLVELLERKGNILYVKGLDAHDQTPVLDLKPADSRDLPGSVRIPKWLEFLEKEPAETRKADLKRCADEL
ncbi:MAG TPA: tRNA (N6-threonylcarbamoyladenosine(37)-N6)-methyltransferase TrmO [Candidatus Bathyarchaeia archaeon]|nr:tRNA (N6-threonylcarbamoyladenosine(37)-N6)-methyltransferase TrmO [Candidatus Bathyarchaeia archaeon]